MKKRTVAVGILSITILAAVGAPAVQAFHGGWWRGRDVASTHPMFPNPGSTATNMLTGEVFDLDFQWSGGAGLAGTATIEMFEQTTGVLVHASVVPAVEDISSVTWVNCPFSNSSGALLEVVPQYSLVASGVLSLGPGAPGGTGDMRNSFCDDSTVGANDPLFYKAFSDYTGTYLGAIALKSPPQATLPPPADGLVGSVEIGAAKQLVAFQLDVHVRDMDHA